MKRNTFIISIALSMVISFFHFHTILYAEENKKINYVTAETYKELPKPKLTDPLKNRTENTQITFYKDSRYKSAYFSQTANGKQFYNGLSQPIYDNNAKWIIDISEHNGNVDFEKVKAAGVDGIILRAGYGVEYCDAKFDRNIKECNRLGIPYGIYLYSYAYDANFAYQEAISLINQLKKYNLSNLRLPIYYDLEDFNSWSDNGVIRKHPTTVKAYNSIVKTFVEAFNDAGYQNVVNIYSYRSKLQTSLNSSYIHSLATWVAEYSSSLNFTNSHYSGHSGWQYKNTGTVDGISTNVDFNVFSNFIFDEHKHMFTNDKESINVGQSKTLSYTSTHVLGTTLNFISSNPDVCDVNAAGKIIAKQTGTVTIAMKDQHKCIDTIIIQVLASNDSLKASSIVNAQQLSISSIQLNYSSVENAIYYDVYRSTSKSGKYYKMTRTSQTSFINKGLTPCQKYYYRIRSVNETANSVLTKPLLVKTKLQVPQFKLSPSQDKIKIEIEEIKGAPYYQLYCRRPNETSFKRIATLKKNNLTFFHNNKTKGVSKYKVCAYRINDGLKCYSDFSETHNILIN